MRMHVAQLHRGIGNLKAGEEVRNEVGLKNRTAGIWGSSDPY
jgi:hypothetical protein